MSLYGALSVGVTGMQAQSNALGIISDNIANVNTVGYKSGTADFSALITDNSANNYSANGNSSADAGYDPSGVLGGNTQLNSLQGPITATSSPTDIAISGSGFFAVNQNTPTSGDLFYTRAGSFTQDANGDLVNSAGYYLQGWPLDVNGNLPASVSGTSVSSAAAIAALKPVNIQQESGTSVTTTTVSLQANLNAAQVAYTPPPNYDPANSAANMASGAVASQFNIPVTVFDSKGTSHTLNAAFLKTSNNTWAVELNSDPASDVAGANGQVTAGTVTFNGDGTLASVSPSLTQPIAVNWTDGAAASSISFSWGTAGQPFGTPGATVIGRSDGLSQLASGYNIENIKQNGTQAGTLTGIAVTQDGYVQATYSNGNTQNLYKVPLAEFTEPDQLQSQTGNVFTPTVDSGTTTFLQPGQGAGTLQSDALEASNVDLGAQLTDMIIAQQSYQSNSKLVSASDTMLQSLVQMDQSITI